jgi:ADP-heptose:LPS heptosyltransferase
VARTAALTGSTAAAPDGERGPRLVVPEDARARAHASFAATSRPLVGLHVSGGRESKQWHLDRFAEVGRRLVAERAGTIVLTGAPGDRDMVEAVENQLAARLLNRPGGPAVINAAGSTDLVDLAALLASIDILITSDTGPMHLAAAVGTPVVALFGPSDPVRYGPRAPAERVLFAADVRCRPCGQVRLPPPRCRGHVPDCMSGIAVEDVVAAARDLLDRRRSAPGHPVPA